jgi:hypothetical protein
MWKNLAQEQTATPDVMRGESFPSGTAWRQAAIVQQESYSNFSIMVENKGLALEEMCRRWITPFILSKMDTTEEISATLDQYGIQEIDRAYISTKAAKEYNNKAVEAVLNDTELPDLGQEQQNVAQELQGKFRYLKPSDIKTKTWKDVLKDFEGDVQYEITTENSDKQAALDTLSSVFTTLASNPMILQDTNARMVFNKILEKTGQISPLEIKENMPALPQMAGVQGSGAVPEFNIGRQENVV